jgi:hypothetical protein
MSPLQNPWVKFIFKSIIAFVSALSITGNALTVTKTEFGWIIFFAPAISTLMGYWSGVFDSTPAPTMTPADVHKSADALAVALQPPTAAEEKKS